MKTYYWGRLYVRFSKMLAALILLIGVVFLCFGAFYYSRTVETLFYKPSAKLNEKIRLTNEAYQDAINQIREAGADRIPGKLSNSLAQEVLGTTYGDSSSLKSLELELKNLRLKIRELKGYLTAPLMFESSSILRVLDKKSGVVPPSSSPNFTGVEQFTYSKLFQVYEDPKSEKARLLAIGELQNFINILAGSAEDPANKATLEKTLSETNYLESIIRIGFLQQGVAEPAPSAVLTQSQNPENAAAKAAKRMRGLLRMAESAVSDEWSVDEQLEGTEELLREELQLCNNAEQSVFQFRIFTLGSILLLTLFTLAICFALLVISDVIAATLDAGYGGLVSSTYFNSITGENP